MGACSSRPRVLEDEDRMPLSRPEVDHRTNVEVKDVEADPVTDKAVMETEDVFEDTLEDHLDEIEIPIKDAEVVEEQEVPSMVEKYVVDAEVVPAAVGAHEEIQKEFEESNMVHEVPDMKESHQEDLRKPESDNVESKTVEAVVEPEGPSEEACQDLAVPESEEKPNASESHAEDVQVQQDTSAPAEPESEEKTDSSPQPLPAGEASQEGTSAPAEPESEVSQAVSESPAQLKPVAAENPFQSFMSSMTKGWGWH